MPFPSNSKSCQPCGCDEGANHICERHTAERVGATEVRVTDPQTGGQKGSKLARFSLIPSQVLWALAEHYGRGASKYADRNWERGYCWSLSMDALERHYYAWKSREDIDSETGSHHLIAVVWHAMALFMFSLCGRGTDDRSELRPL